jgi:hypothetical protein
MLHPGGAAQDFFQDLSGGGSETEGVARSLLRMKRAQVAFLFHPDRRFPVSFLPGSFKM